MSGMTPFKRMNTLKTHHGGHLPVPEGTQVYRNNLYTVHVEQRSGLGGKVMLTHLSIKRNGREPIHDWADLQAIKNAICGPEAEAVELYPAESRLVNAANQYHLWVLPIGLHWPVGFNGGRQVFDSNQAKLFGATQREPDDVGHSVL